MPQEPWRSVADELARRAANPLARRRPPHGPPPQILREPDLASIRVLSERSAGDRCAVALTVNDATGERYLIIRELVRDPAEDGDWRSCSGCEGQDRVIPGKPDPSYVSLYAYAHDGHLFAGGRVQSGSTDPTRLRVQWDDGYALEDEIQNGIALFFGTRDALAPATVEFLDPSGLVLGAHVTFIDEP
jgi:hypothetical protein